MESSSRQSLRRRRKINTKCETKFSETFDFANATLDFISLMSCKSRTTFHMRFIFINATEAVNCFNIMLKSVHILRIKKETCLQESYLVYFSWPPNQMVLFQQFGFTFIFQSSFLPILRPHFDFYDDFYSIYNSRICSGMMKIIINISLICCSVAKNMFGARVYRNWINFMVSREKCVGYKHFTGGFAV